ncbi:Wzz/FepE/Etk N-terminal domain-containing protein [Alkalibacterium psychrotolerans]
MEEEISLVELFDILKKRLGLIISATLTGLLLVSFYTFFMVTPEYSSTTQLLVNRAEGADTIQQSDINTNIQLINTYKDIITGPVILDEVRDELNMTTSHAGLSNRLSISSENNSQVFSIRVTDTNPYNAALIANTTADVFQESLPDIMNVDNVTVISVAEANTSPISPNHTLNMAIGVVLGAMIGVGIAFLIEFLDNTVKDERFIVEELGWTNLGSVSKLDANELKIDKRQIQPERLSESRTARARV